jgi:hypothetical protein
VAFAFIAGTTAGSISTGVTTTAIDTTGANLIVISVATFVAFITPTLSDSKSNTWTALTGQNSTNEKVQLYYCVAPTVGSGHTFTWSGTSTYPVVSVMAFSGSHATPFDAESGTFSAGATSLAPGSLTPSVANCLVITGINYGTGTAPSVGGGFTALTTDTSAGNFISGGIGRLIQTTAAAANPTWSWTGSSESAAALAVFKPAIVAVTPHNLTLLGVGK